MVREEVLPRLTLTFGGLLLIHFPRKCQGELVNVLIKLPDTSVARELEQSCLLENDKPTGSHMNTAQLGDLRPVRAVF